MSTAKPTERSYQGIGVSGGVASGTIYVYNIPEETVPEYDISEAQIPDEIARFEQALMATREQLRELQEQIAKGVGSDTPSNILDVHLSITSDPTIIEPVITRLPQEHKNVEFIFHEVAQKYITTLGDLSDEYFRERAVDIQDVARRILRNLLGRGQRPLDNLPANTIIVAHDLVPSETSSLDREHIVGFATDVGSPTSHTAILARSMNLPAVVGLHDVSKHVQTGQSAVLDGYSGTLIIEPKEQTLYVYGQFQVRRRGVQERLASLKDLPAETIDGHRIILSGNIDLPEDLDALLTVRAEGIGLFRTEFLYLNRRQFPSEEEQYENYIRIARAVKPHSVIIRTLDLGGDKLHPTDGQTPEINPFLGLRAIRYCLAHEEVFETQLRAILRASAEGNVSLMYPMISGVSEVIQANEVLSRVMEELKTNNIPYNDQIQVGSMMEIPSAALTAETIASEVDFFSIGTNDLIQYTMAVDRINEKVANLYEPAHPAILRLIRNCVEAAHNNGIWVGICGEIAGDPLYTPLLVGMGVDELSVSGAESLSSVKEIIRRIHFPEAQELASSALQATQGEDVMGMLHALIERIDPDLLTNKPS